MIGTFAFSARLAVSRSPGDWLLGSLGFLSAAGSAGFAAYMVVVGPVPRSIPPGGGDFPVFGAFDRRPVRQAEAPALSEAPALAALRTAGPAPSEIDFTPTGSIGPVPRPAGSPTALPGAGAGASAAPKVLGGYALYDVFDGKAVVEVRNKLTIVEPGSTIEGAGPVLAIKRDGGRWVVETAQGLIAR